MSTKFFFFLLGWEDIPQSQREKEDEIASSQK